MGLADVLRAPVAARGVPQCHVRELLKTLDAKDSKVLAEILVMPISEYPSTVLARRLADAGYKVTSFSLQRHRRGDCKCP